MSSEVPDPEVAVVHTRETPPDAWQAAIFLAGPSPRDPAVPSWRPEAVDLLSAAWQGPGRLVIFVPEPREREREGHFDYVKQVGWEESCLNLADIVLFWVPRDLELLPAFTTNVEWGMWHDSGRVVFGAPPDAPRNRYLLHYAAQYTVRTEVTLPATAAAALRAIGAGAPRERGERCVPLQVWLLPSFQRWYGAQRHAGNILLSARVVWTFRPDDAVFYWALHVEVEIASEGRAKTNEVVLSRPDISVVALYHPGPTLDETEIVLVREFRSPASTPDGFVHELPGGAVDDAHPLDQAVREVAEETGLALDPARLRSHGSRQLAATLSAHHAHLFSAQLTDAELAHLRTTGPRTSGTERTHPEIVTYAQIRHESLVDWTTLGLLTQVLTP